MQPAAQTAVEFTLGPDHLDIWVDANNNGLRDDDDVNLYISATGSIYTTSPTFKKPLDKTIQDQIKTIAVEMIKRGGAEQKTVEALRALSLELVLKATNPSAADLAVEIDVRDDSLDIWVDANNNGQRDDDDVNIYVTAAGGFYTTSPTFKYPLDSDIQAQIKAQASAMLSQGQPDHQAMNTLRELALALVVKAVGEQASA